MPRSLLPKLCAAICALVLHGASHADDKDMYRMASALTKLTAAVDAQVFFTPGGGALDDAGLLAAVASSQPDLLPNFSSYVLRIHRYQAAVVLLVCTGDATEAVLEDVSCTARLDRHHWRDTPGSACMPTTNVAQVCGR